MNFVSWRIRRRNPCGAGGGQAGGCLAAPAHRPAGALRRRAETRILGAVAASGKDAAMPKAYWVGTYRSVSDPEKLSAYAVIAGPAITAGGGRFLVRGMPSQVYESGMQQRTVVIEFDSVEQARATHDSADYQKALAALGDGAVRDIRIVEGV